MKAQVPAQGVLQVNNWGYSKMYKAVCQCGNDDCTHTIDIEAEDTGISVTIYTTTRTDFWSKSRWQHIWKLLTKGYVDYETSIIMDKQTALNYARVLAVAVEDVDNIRKENVKNKNS
jgi:hypothetical protein